MGTLLGILTSISLVDSTSILPLCVVPLAVLLAGRRPVFGSAMFIAGVSLAYFGVGMLLLLSIDSFIDQFTAFIVQKWKHPDTIDLVLQIIIGFLLLILGYRMVSTRVERGAEQSVGELTPTKGFTLGAGLTIAGLWGAFPYFAAIDQILRADLSVSGMILTLAYYNLVFVLPLAALVAIHAALGTRSDSVLQAVKTFFQDWGRRLVIGLFVVLGIVLVADGVGWFLGVPLIPITGLEGVDQQATANLSSFAER